MDSISPFCPHFEFFSYRRVETADKVMAIRQKSKETKLILVGRKLLFLLIADLNALIGGRF